MFLAYILGFWNSPNPFLLFLFYLSFPGLLFLFHSLFLVFDLSFLSFFLVFSSHSFLFLSLLFSFFLWPSGPAKALKTSFSQDEPGLYVSRFLCFFSHVSVFLDSLSFLCCLSCCLCSCFFPFIFSALFLSSSFFLFLLCLFVSFSGVVFLAMFLSTSLAYFLSTSPPFFLLSLFLCFFVFFLAFCVGAFPFFGGGSFLFVLLHLHAHLCSKNLIVAKWCALVFARCPSGTR